MFLLVFWLWLVFVLPILFCSNFSLLLTEKLKTMEQTLDSFSKEKGLEYPQSLAMDFRELNLNSD